ncbi:translation elongation factor Tu [Rhinocladiella mackenziei CBS 650.93]|uniref:Elongation factor 1 alpha-like protein n=1 Tax=Rhinocladiella mackenziei CBS 650.93 TaxID=1442369 RepID=A0A0D2IL62_9EURO|nr:translation elongation factor Tu [Rhinocladiella mackenziei CBS 650.93]KIX03946.1 translation elongation factor Tu [Rhinocladiella mackenziei CBS 650.93]
MSNRRVKSLAIEDDDYDDYDDYEDEYNQAGDTDLSPEDKEQLRQGTIKVREAIGPASSVTDKEIQDTLWHYYYDIGKSVSYLKSMLLWINLGLSQPLTGSDIQRPQTAPTKKQTQPTKKCVSSATCSTPFSAADFFKDCPWLQIPAHRKAEIIIEPLYPHLGLLGGASKGGKVSKLAALAAKRRQHESERSGPSTVNGSTSQDDYITSLNKLRISQPSRIKEDSARAADSLGNELVKVEAESSGADKGNVTEQTGSPELRAEKVTDISVSTSSNIRGAPSAFASIMTSHDAGNYLSVPRDLFSGDMFTKCFDFAEPSPDDVVATARESKAVGPSKPKSKEVSASKATLSNGMQELSIQPSPVKSKNVDVISEYGKIKRKNAANVVVIGHVDAGKSTLMGRLLFDLHAVDQRTMDQYRKEAERIGKGSFAFAWVLDQGSEERARGVTIDIATNKFETDKTSFTILDAPGHKDFVPNMIAGASQADLAVLVIDASTGNFESGLKGQTKEHALLVRSIGVQRIIVAVNKMDAAAWSPDRYEEIRQQMSAFLNSAGFQSKNVAFVPCSGLEGGNILTRASDPRSSWYTGPTLVEELDMSEPSTYALDKPLRMTISDVFRGAVQNPLSVSGRVEAGNIQIGEQVVIMPSGEKAQIRSLEVDEEPHDWAVAGQNVVLNLTDVDPIHLKTGDVLCSPLSPIQNINEFKAKILAFDHLTPMNVDVHRGRLHVPGRIIQLIGLLDKSTGAVVKKKPKIVQPGHVVRVVVQLDQAVPLEAPSRVVLRANGETVAAGLIE